MDASQTSDLILSIIKKSNLNFSLSESPFSVSIQIKKTFIKDKDGSTRSSSLNENSSKCNNSQDSYENLHRGQQQQDVDGVHHHSLHPQHVPTNTHPRTPPDPHVPQLLPQAHYHNPFLQFQKTERSIQQPFPNSFLHVPVPYHHHVPKHPLHHANEPNHLSIGLQDHQVLVHVPNIPVQNQFSCLASSHVLSGDNISNSLEMSANNITREVNNNTENGNHIIGEIVDPKEIEYLAVNNRRLKQVTKRLNKELARVRTESKKNKSDAVKDLKVEIKQWRKSLGQERSEKIKLEKKLILIKNSPSEASSSSNSTEPKNESEKLSEEVDETCSICVRPIPNYIPRYSNGLQWNPACSDCDDPSDDDENDETPG